MKLFERFGDSSVKVETTTSFGIGAMAFAANAAIKEESLTAHANPGNDPA
ncbi:hypothetical protein QM996_16065 [Sinorhizobium chiapasense]